MNGKNKDSGFFILFLCECEYEDGDYFLLVFRKKQQQEKEFVLEKLSYENVTIRMIYF